MAQRTEKDMWESMVFQMLSKLPISADILNTPADFADKAAKFADAVMVERAKRFPEKPKSEGRAVEVEIKRAVPLTRPRA